ncbi:MAG TPA: PPC domain-containing protein [Candidatus Eisenbacteria bacterium]
MSHRDRVLPTVTAAAVALFLASAAQAGLPRIASEKVPQSDEVKWDVMETFDLNATLAEIEPNDTQAQAQPMSCGDVINPAYLEAGGFDVYRFTATAGQLLTLGTDSNGGLDTDTWIYLIDAAFTTALAQDDDSGPGAYSLISGFAAPYTGTYYFAVEGYDVEVDEGDYRGFVNCSSTPPPTNCSITDYKGQVVTLPTPVAIPDNNLAGVSVGTINTPNDLTKFLDVIVSLKVTHTWVGDLVATLTYDETCDGQPEASSRFICRPGRATCDNVLGTPFGCSSNLACANNMFFSDGATNVLGTSPTGCGTSSTVLAAGCWKGGSNAQPLSVFDNFRKGGCFKLNVADYGSGDTGTVCEWGVYTLNESIVPVAPTTWGALKSGIRFEN